jgi:hypothetical protein
VATIIHHAAFPMGFYSPMPDVDKFLMSDIDVMSVLDAFRQGHSIHDSSIPMSCMGSAVDTVSPDPSNILVVTPAETSV